MPSKITRLCSFTREWGLLLCVTNLILLSFWSCLWNGYYLGKWIPIALAGALFATDILWRRYGAALAINFLYCTGSTIWIDCAANRYSTVPPYDLQAIKLFSVEAGWKLALAALPFLYLAANPNIQVGSIRRIGRLFFITFLLISTAKVLWEWATKGCEGGFNQCGGALLNPSLNAAMMAVLLPLVPAPLFFAALTALCAFVGKTSIGAGMVALYLAGWALVRAPRKWRAPLLLLAPAVMALGYFTHGAKNFFDSSGRFQMWDFFLRLWAMSSHNWLFGVGFGTFGVFSLNLQHAFNKNPNDWWIWPHNEGIEQVFVGGVVGGALLLWLGIDVAYKLYRKGYRAELSSFLLFGVASMGEYFLHIGPCCAFAVWILTIALFTPQNEPTGEMQ